MSWLYQLNVAVKKDERIRFVRVMGESWTTQYESERIKAQEAMIENLTDEQEQALCYEYTKYGISSEDLEHTLRFENPERPAIIKRVLDQVLANAKVNTTTELREVCEAIHKMNPPAVALWAATQIQQLNERKQRTASVSTEPAKP